MLSFFWQFWLLLGVLALVQTFVGGVHLWENRRFAAARIGGKRRSTARCLAARVCVPCKGLDVELADNLRPLFWQDYERYELAFIVESADDPAAPVIRALIAAHPQIPAQLIVAGRAAQCGQKVHNLRAATAELDPRVEVLAFLDSDARPRPDWLRRLIERLSKVECGAATGYRWFVPQRHGLGNWLLYSINAQVAAMLGPGGHHVVWGGSWAIRRTTFTALSIRDHWASAVSDDLVATRLLQQADMQIEFVPHCMVESPLASSLPQALEFIRRQYVMVRFHLPRVLLYTGLILTLSVAGFWGAALVAFSGWQAGANWWPILAGVCAAQYGLSLARAVIRQRFLWTCLPEAVPRLKLAQAFDTLCTPVATLLHWLGLISALMGTEVTWRGIRYRLRPGGQVELVAHREATAPPSRVVPAPHRSIKHTAAPRSTAETPH